MRLYVLTKHHYLLTIALVAGLSSTLTPLFAMDNEPGNSLKEEESKPTVPMQRKAAQKLEEAWASDYDFSQTNQEWAQQLDFPPEIGMFDNHPDYQRAIQPLLKSEVKLQREDPLAGIICFRLIAHRIGLAPIRNSYFGKELEFFKRQITGFVMGVQMNMNTFKWVPHDLRDIKPEELEKLEKILNNPKADNSKKRLAKKKILYSRIPWRQLESIGRLTHKMGKNIYHENEQGLFNDALPSLINEFRLLTRSFADIINFYQKDSLGSIDQILPVTHATPAIFALGSFIRDHDSSQRMQNILTTMGRISLSEVPKSLKYRYAALRALNIIGEAGILMSSQVRHSIIDSESWHAFQSIRNAFHNFEEQQHLHNLLLSLEDSTLLFSILSSFQNLSSNLPGTFLSNRRVKWSDVYASYSSQTHPNSFRLIDIINLAEIMMGHLTVKEKMGLSIDIQQRFNSSAEPRQRIHDILLKVDGFLNHLQEAEPQIVFDGILEKVLLPPSQRAKLKELYKKMREIRKKQNNSTNGTSAKQIEEELSIHIYKSKTKIEEILKSPDDNRKTLDTVIKKDIYGFTSWEDEKSIEGDKKKSVKGLKTKLRECGVETDLNLWQDTFVLIQSRKSKILVKKSQESHKISILCTKIQKDIESFLSLFQDYKTIPASQRLAYYEKDSVTHLAAEYLLSNFREDTQNLWDILAAKDRDNPSSEQFKKACNTLDEYIHRAKEILHNHDITEISSVTPMGEQYRLVLKDMPFLLGAWGNIEFPLNDATLNLTTIYAQKIKIPIVDKRIIPSKDKKIQGLTKKQSVREVKEFKSQYPALESDWKKIAREEINLLKMMPGPFQEIYKHLTVDNHYILYAPPSAHPHNLFALLEQLKKQKFSQSKKSEASKRSHLLEGVIPIQNTPNIPGNFQVLYTPADENACLLYSFYAGLSPQNQKEIFKLKGKEIRVKAYQDLRKSLDSAGDDLLQGNGLGHKIWKYGFAQKKILESWDDFKKLSLTDIKKMLGVSIAYLKNNTGFEPDDLLAILGMIHNRKIDVYSQTNNQITPWNDAASGEEAISLYHHNYELDVASQDLNHFSLMQK